MILQSSEGVKAIADYNLPVSVKLECLEFGVKVAKHWSAIAATVSVLALAGAAFAHTGVQRTDADLNDGGVWITNRSEHLVGRLNYYSREVDTVLRTGSSSFDVTQDRDDVLVPDTDTATASLLDTMNAEFSQQFSFAAGTRLFQGADRVVLVDSRAGTIKASLISAIFGSSEIPPLITGEEGVVANAGIDGSIHAANPRAGTVTTIPTTKTGWANASSAALAVDPSADLAVTAVGGHTIVLDKGNGIIHLPGNRSVALKEQGLTLQQPGPEAPHVLVASRTSLIAVPLDGSEPRIMAASDDGVAAGVPTAPVRLNGCDYSAWAGSGSFLRACEGESEDRRHDDLLASSTQPIFRVNRDLIVLNDVQSGSTWLPDDQLVLVNDWTSATAQTDDDSDTRDDSASTSEKASPPERTEENHQPEARDDDFGVRPGRSTTLPVTANDYDQDGDILTVTPVDHSTLGRVTTVRSDRALQIDIPDDAAGSFSIPYSAQDGRGMADSAVATVTVHPWSDNVAPIQNNVPSLTLSESASGSIDVLSGWSDPDGDPVVLVSVEGEGFDFHATHEGRVTVRETSGGVGPRTASVTVSDGFETTTGQLAIDVVPASEALPVAYADHVKAIAGIPTTISPLANDVSPSGRKLQLAQLQDPPAGTRIDIHQDAGSFEFSSAVAQTYYLDYAITDGPEVARSIIRIDVVEPSDPSVPPSVENDTATLRNGGSTTIAPLANDSDPAGGVLILQSVDVPANTPLKAAIIDHSFVQLSTADALTDQVSLTYTVTNGTASATGTIAVTPLGITQLQTPLVENDTAVVRVNDIVTIPVLDNDSSPSGLNLSLDPTVESTDSQLGDVWVSDSVIRFKANDIPGRTTLAYTAMDDRGQTSMGTVELEIMARNDDQNSPPTPRDLDARALVDSPTTIAIPLNNIDADGDSVTLVGVDQAPSMGTVKVEPTWLTYTPAPGAAGTDTITYIVEDRFGLEATATIRVGVAPASTLDSPPQAVNDIVTVKPSRTVSIDAVSNDIDPDGDPLTLIGIPTSTDGLSVTTRGGQVLLTAPETEGVYSLQYTVSDSKGATAIGTITIQVSNNAPLLAPVAADDTIALQNVDSNDRVTVDVLANDMDPDGSSWDLTITTADPTAKVTEDGIELSIDDEWRLVVYTVTDVDGLTGKAVIVVPGKSGLTPRIDATSVPVRIPAGTSTDVDIVNHVITRSGTSPVVADQSTLRTGVGLRSSTWRDSDTVRLTPAQDFQGATSITFDVADGTGGDALSSTVTLPILVVSNTNSRPVFTPTKVSLSPGEDPTVIDLAPMVHDEDGDEIRYAVGSAPSGFTASLSGSRLTLAAQSDVSTGTTGLLPVTVDDGITDAVTESFVLTAAESTYPLMTAASASLTSAGEPVSIDVTSLVTNPFPGKEISLYGFPRVTSGSGEVSVTGTDVTITPQAGFHGRIVVEYRVLDATANPSRAVTGTITVAVTALPARPTGVRAVAKGATSISVSWAAAADHGSPITGYTVVETGGAGTWRCAASPCVATGLTTGQTYSFTVTATNAVGQSEPSAPSAPLTLKVTPQPPSTPKLEGGEGTVTATWTPVPPIEGASIVYEVVLSNGASLTVTDPSAVFPVPAGTYTVRVRARVDGGGGDSEWVTSNSVSVYGKPGTPGTPVINASQPDGFTVSWAPADPNGAPVTYTVSVRGAVEQTIDAGASTSAVVSSLTPGDYTVTVTATNQAGSTQSVPVQYRLSDAPLAPSAPALAATGVSGVLSVATPATPRTGNSWTADALTIEYRIVSQSGEEATSWAATTLFSGLTNGRSFTLQARAVGTLPDGTVLYSPAVESSAAVPYGPPSQPTVECRTTSAQRIDCSWSPGATGGLPNSYLQATTASGSGSTAVSVNETRTFNVSPGETATWCISATNTAGQSSGWACSSATATTTSAHFAPLMNVPEAVCTQDDLDLTNWPSSLCRRIVLDITGFSPNSTVSCKYEYQQLFHPYALIPYSESITMDGTGSKRHIFPHRIKTTNTSFTIECTQQ